ncbi:PadR family transcriptional regulator [Bacillus bombysepticus]|uniref:PadR family transcriptional regulator n=1 Tax=Bacillus TaxID=1386 RepID=UPI001F49553D|nr:MULTISPECIES: PadR family transcriptional regulator [Bacillus]MDJ0280622.1 PadR family transcriptional regulator [Bacillus bombysepticus]MDJ0294757.1 PadR family transcriptional regulator [Bacillus bombysepticus]MDJ0300847.1 PadR family transcriptional regulator [Bacillus bombysepticus]MEB9917591.1 PadR family transcriptional regulator [Bacillus cereus]MEC0056749.1 PadR family transcriptional regulator [Bacillus cereus]
MVRFECRRLSLNRYLVLNRRYNEKIVDISGEMIDISEKSLIYFSEYEVGDVEKKLP